jgi:ribosomal-protein-alanine N-acetyltransferase
MPGTQFLNGERVTLRSFEEEDIGLYKKIRNDPNVGTGLTVHYPMNESQIREHFEKQVSDDEGIDLVICTDDDHPIGTVDLQINRDCGWGEIGIFILPEYHGEGYGTEVSELITKYGFSELRLHRICARVNQTNTASRRVWQKLGFQEEGVQREAVFKDGEYLDVYWYSVLEDEWQDRFDE